MWPFKRKQKMAKDPVCGMEVDPTKAQWTSTHGGGTYYFCSKGCKADFDKEPEKYASTPAGSEGGGLHGH